MDLKTIRQTVSEDLAALDHAIVRHLNSDVPLINTIGHHLINSGGKRLRPLLLIIAARACGYQGEAHITLAAIVEFIHTATLLHDDVVDHAALRRGQQTANAKWGSQASVLVGDFIYSRAFQLMVGLDSMTIMEILADTTNKIAEGEVLQLFHCEQQSLTEQEYYQVIEYKTAILFQAATELAAVVSQNTALQTPLREFGMQLGLAYQIIDDALDYRANQSEFGKTVGQDLAEGKVTLPLLFLLKQGDSEQQALVRQSIGDPNPETLKHIQQAIVSSNAIPYTVQIAKDFADKASKSLGALPSSKYKEALQALVEFTVAREY